ncbi:MAG: hypothetical protein ACRDJJ_10245 [Actinomycetota bacterium]
MRRSRPTDSEIDAVLSGKGPEGHPDLFALAIALSDLRGSLARVPTEPSRTGHVVASAEAARSLALSGRDRQTVVASPRRNPMTRLLAKIALAALSLFALTGGLAMAGVDLPVLPDQGQASVSGLPEDALDAEGSETATSVLTTIDDLLQNLESEAISKCEFGHAVAEAAGAEVEGDCPDASATGRQRSAPGGAKAEDASATARDKAAEGKAKAEDARSSSGGGGLGRDEQQPRFQRGR